MDSTPLHAPATSLRRTRPRQAAALAACAGVALPLASLSVPGSALLFIATACAALLLLPRRAESRVPRGPYAPLACALLFLLPVGIVASPLPFAAQWPFLCCFLWSLLLFFTLRDAPFAAPAAAPAAEPAAELAVGDARPAAPSSGIDPLSFPLFMALSAAVAAGAAVLAWQERLPGIATVAEVSRLRAMPGLLAAFDANDAAAVAAMLVPLGCVLLVSALRRPAHAAQLPAPCSAARARHAALLSVSLLALFAVLYFSQGRAAFIATGVACALLAALSGTRGRIVLGLLLAAGIVAVMSSGVDRIAERFLLQGKTTGYSAEHVLTNRVAVWDRTLFLLRDFPAAGIGLGAYPALVPALYPLPAVMDVSYVPDAHNALLQSAADFGFAGPLILSLLAGAALLRAWRSLRRGGPHAATAAGLLCSLAAFLICGGTEALGAGTPSGLAFWLLLALVVRLPAETSAPLRLRRPRVRAMLLPALPALLACALLAFPGLLPVAGADWLRGMACSAAGDSAGRDRAWLRLLAARPSYIRLLAEAAPMNRALAERAARLHPRETDALFWLASIASSDDTVRAIALYRNGLALDPQDGLRWCHLGQLLVSRDLRAATAAFLESCRHGDPGSNGCLLAGRSAERLGDTAAAISYYRLSRYPPARRRADELEALLRRP